MVLLELVLRPVEELLDCCVAMIDQGREEVSEVFPGLGVVREAAAGGGAELDSDRASRPRGLEEGVATVRGDGSLHLYCALPSLLGATANPALFLCADLF